MANALHATLSSRQRRRLRELRHDPALKPRERDRVEALLLSADGMRNVPIAVQAIAGNNSGEQMFYASE